MIFRQLAYQRLRCQRLASWATTTAACLTLSTAGCSDRPQADGAKDGLPNRPACSQSEQPDLVMKDGTLADIRIIQIDHIKLYVPTSWLNLKISTYRDYYHPGIYQIECPGIVHHFVSLDHIFDLDWWVVFRAANTPPRPSPNFASESKISRLAIVRPRGADSSASGPGIIQDGIVDWPTDQSTSGLVALRPSHLVARFPWPRSDPVGSSEWKRVRVEVFQLFGWLQRPPRSRDNSEVFTL